eukprot:Plantae.Rhodophyta-Rhodochaete_pulchella.ctg20575.p1 GENE.Plantae.Rhodophyta-Rhodochaete_pulchella.ctg20575~~Plantae.Rhodophyta-Rhodochaete_pulchella.ctg20575.p1  ORF type:complete len:120 (+),score=6.45 Plantae.Rhodophyta-Rhodochaete_pulchella.ctg20575:272-631(+)
MHMLELWQLFLLKPKSSFVGLQVSSDGYSVESGRLAAFRIVSIPPMAQPCRSLSGPVLAQRQFFDRKSRYSMNDLITNDLKKRIINVVLGFPGSVHDARVLRAARSMRPEYDVLAANIL